MHRLEVGTLYVPGKTHWPEATEYNYYANGHELRFFLNNIAPGEKMDIKKAVAKFGLLIEGPVIFLLYEIGKINGDAPYSWHLVPENLKPRPGIPEGREQALLQIHLIEASTGILQVLRAVTLSHNFTLKLHLAIEEQRRQKFNSTQYNQVLREVYARHPSTQAMFDVAKVTCIGGK